MARAFEITDQGTDREILLHNGLRYWLDVTSDPGNAIGWVVEDQHGVQDLCTVAEASSVPGAREYVRERTREGIKRAHAAATEHGWPPAVVQALLNELREAA